MEFDNDAHNAWVSKRFTLEAERRNRIAAFDKFVDLALDGVIEMPQAISGFVEEYGHEYETAPEGAASILEG